MEKQELLKQDCSETYVDTIPTNTFLNRVVKSEVYIMVQWDIKNQIWHIAKLILVIFSRHQMPCSVTSGRELIYKKNMLRVTKVVIQYVYLFPI